MQSIAGGRAGRDRGARPIVAFEVAGTDIGSLLSLVYRKEPAEFTPVDSTPMHPKVLELLKTVIARDARVNLTRDIAQLRGSRSLGSFDEEVLGFIDGELSLETFDLDGLLTVLHAHGWAFDFSSPFEPIVQIRERGRLQKSERAILEDILGPSDRFDPSYWVLEPRRYNAGDSTQFGWYGDLGAFVVANADSDLNERQYADALERPSRLTSQRAIALQEVGHKALFQMGFEAEGATPVLVTMLGSDLPAGCPATDDIDRQAHEFVMDAANLQFSPADLQLMVNHALDPCYYPEYALSANFMRSLLETKFRERGLSFEAEWEKIRTSGNYATVHPSAAIRDLLNLVLRPEDVSEIQASYRARAKDIMKVIRSTL